MTTEGEPDPEDWRTWPELQEVIKVFLAMGRERSPPTWDDHESLDTARDRMYRIGNPNFRQRFITILGIAEDEPISPDQIANWERALRLRIPWGRWPRPKISN